MKALDRAYVVQSLPSKSRSSLGLGLCAEDTGVLHLGVDVDEVVDWGELGDVEVDEVDDIGFIDDEVEIEVDVEVEANVDVDEVDVRRTILVVVIYGGWSRRSVWKFWV